MSDKAGLGQLSLLRFLLYDHGECCSCLQTPQSAVQTRIMLTQKSTYQDMDQVSVLSSDIFRKDFGQAVSVTSNGSKVDLRQTLTFDHSVGIYDVTAKSSISGSDVCNAVAAASGDCGSVCLHLPVSSRQDVAGVCLFPLPPPPPPLPNLHGLCTL